MATDASQSSILLQNINRLLWRGYRFGGSLKLAVVVIVGLAATLSFATVYESLHGTKEVQAMVYNTPWFIALLTLLGINISFSAAQRFPWKKRLLGFVMAHLGILMLLYGGALTRLYGLDGTLALEPGETSNLLTIDDPQIEIWDKNKKGFVLKDSLSLKSNRAPLELTLKSTDGEHQVKILQILPKAVSSVEFREVKTKSENPPALLLELSSVFMGMNVRQWLRAGDPQWGNVTLGLANLSFVADSKMRPLSASANPHNKMPGPGTRNELQILANPDLSLRYVLRSKNGEKKGSLNASDLSKANPQWIETGWRDIKVRIVTLVPHSELFREYREPSTEELSRQNDWISALKLSFDGDEARFVEYQDSLEWNQYLLRFGPKLVAIPFSLTLEKFEMGKYPGTDRAKTYSSFIKLTEPSPEFRAKLTPEMKESIHITMNEPFVYRALTFYQASYQENEGEGATSILSVGLDPGRRIKYFGSILLVLGIVVMFFQKRGLKFLIPKRIQTKSEFTKTVGGLATFLLLFSFLSSAALCGNVLAQSTAEAPPSYALSLSLDSLNPQQREALDLLSHLPLQNGGRIKPLDSFARDTILFIAEGRRISTVSEWDAKLSPLLLLRDWLLYAQLWSRREFIPVKKDSIKEGLGLLFKKHPYYSPAEILGAGKLQAVMANFGEQQRLGHKLNTLEKDMQRVLEKAQLFHGITSGTLWTVLPGEPAWFSLVEPLAMTSGVGPLLAKAFETLSPEDAKTLAAVQISPLAKNSNGTDATDASMPSLKSLADKLNREVQFNRLRPFQKSWILYGIAFLFLLFGRIFQGGRSNLIKGLGLGAFIAAFAMHTYGFVLRCLLTGHPPVTNMYESTVWVPWGVAIFALGIFVAYRKHPRALMVLLAASLVSMFALILSDNVPAVLDPTIRPLEPVLRSNYWLTIHVLTITLAYAAFALSLGLGNLTLGYYLFKPQENETISVYTEFTYRAVQVGVVLLAAGTILGGIWADYSWGRFWGWDPKETWALIALLLYVAVLHGRWAGWLKPFGLILGTVCCFLGVLMAWYGVNFVLGVGLHSYGFATGGLEYVAAFIIVQMLFVALVGVKRHLKKG